MIFPRLAIVIQPLQETSYAEFSEKTDPQKAALASESEKQGRRSAKARVEHPHSDDSVVVAGVENVPTEAKPRIHSSFESSSRSELVFDSALYLYKFD